MMHAPKALLVHLETLKKTFIITYKYQQLILLLQ